MSKVIRAYTNKIFLDFSLLVRKKKSHSTTHTLRQYRFKWYS